MMPKLRVRSRCARVGASVHGLVLDAQHSDDGPLRVAATTAHIIALVAERAKARGEGDEHAANDEHERRSRCRDGVMSESDGGAEHCQASDEHHRVHHERGHVDRALDADELRPRV